MDGEDQLLIISDVTEGEGRLGRDVTRQQTFAAIKDSGARLQHDSGGRLLVIEATEDTQQILRRELQGAEIFPIEKVTDQRLESLDPQDSLFVRALRLRVSPEYREMKRRQQPGETPEEQLLISGPCTPPEG